MTLADLQTKSGYRLDEVISALQKTIRRGKEEEALYWALELCPKYEAYLWRRLLVVAYEDVSSLGAMPIPTVVSQMMDDYFWFRERGDVAALLVLTNAILLLCRAPKTRVSDHFILTMGHRLDRGWQLEIPDYALDKHTRRGKQMGRGIPHFFEEGTRLEPLAEIADPYREELRTLTANGRWGAACFGWTREAKRRVKRTHQKPSPEVQELSEVTE